MGTGSVEVLLFPRLCALPTVPVPIFHPAVSGPGLRQIEPLEKDAHK